MRLQAGRPKTAVADGGRGVSPESIRNGCVGEDYRFAIWPRHKAFTKPGRHPAKSQGKGPYTLTFTMGAMERENSFIP